MITLFIYLIRSARDDRAGGQEVQQQQQAVRKHGQVAATTTTTAASAAAQSFACDAGAAHSSPARRGRCLSGAQAGHLAAGAQLHAGRGVATWHHR